MLKAKSTDIAHKSKVGGAIFVVSVGLPHTSRVAVGWVGSSADLVWTHSHVRGRLAVADVGRSRWDSWALLHLVLSFGRPEQIYVICTQGIDDPPSWGSQSHPQALIKLQSKCEWEAEEYGTADFPRLFTIPLEKVELSHRASVRLAYGKEASPVLNKLPSFPMYVPVQDMEKIAHRFIHPFTQQIVCAIPFFKTLEIELRPK